MGLKSRSGVFHTIQEVRNKINAIGIDNIDKILEEFPSLRINEQKQNKHIPGTLEYNQATAHGDEKSHFMLDIKQCQELAIKAAVNGYYKKNKIVVKNDVNVGTVYCSSTDSFELTSYCTVHLSKSGAHLVPHFASEEEREIFDND